MVFVDFLGFVGGYSFLNQVWWENMLLSLQILFLPQFTFSSSRSPVYPLIYFQHLFLSLLYFVWFLLFFIQINWFLIYSSQSVLIPSKNGYCIYQLYFCLVLFYGFIFSDITPHLFIHCIFP